MSENTTKIVITAEDKTRAALDSIRTNLGGLQSSVAALGVTLSVGAFAAFVKGTIDAADAMNDLSQRTGIAVKDLATWKLAADQSGTSLETVAKGVKALSGFYAEHSDRLKAAGITAKDANGAMVQLADIFAGMPDGLQKTALAVEIFGKAGMEMIPMLNMGSQGLAEAQEKAKLFGERMAELAPKADAFNDKLSELKIGAQSLGLAFSGPLVEGMKYAIVAGGNIAFVLNGIGREIGGIGAQIASVFGSGAGMKTPGQTATEWTAIGEAMRADAEKARKEFDAWQEKVLAIDSELESAKPTGRTDAPEAAATLNPNKAGKTARAGRAAAEKQEKDDYLAFLRAGAREQAAMRQALDEQIASEEQAVTTYGLSRAAIEELNIARLEDARATEAAHGASALALADMDMEIEQRKKLARLLASHEALDANKKAAEESARAWERITDDINHSLADAIMGGGVSGGELLKRYFKTLVLTPAISAVMSPVTNAVGSVLGSAAGSAGSSAISSLGSSLFGSVISDSVGGVGGIYSAAAYSSIGQALGLTQAVSTGGMAMTGLGSAIGAALPWVGGALAIGSALGLFGGGGEDPHNNAQWSGYDFILNKAGVQGSGNPWSGATVKGPAYTVTGRTSGKGYWSEMSALSADQIAAINQAVGSVFANGAAFASALGIDPSVIDSASVNSGIAGVSTPGAPLTFKTIDDALAALSESIALKVIPNLKEFQTTGETLATTAQRLQAEFSLTNQIAQMMGKSASEIFGGSNLSARDSLITLMGGVGTASTAIGSYYQNYFSGDEIANNTRGQIGATLKSLGIGSVPTTRAEFRALVEAQDLTSESGRKMYATLIAVADAFAGVTAAATKSLATSGFRSRLDYQRAMFGKGATPEETVVGQIQSLRDETRAMAIALAQANNETAKILRRWNGDGMPATRTTA